MKLIPTAVPNLAIAIGLNGTLVVLVLNTEQNQIVIPLSTDETAAIIASLEDNLSWARRSVSELGHETRRKMPTMPGDE